MSINCNSVYNMIKSGRLPNVKYRDNGKHYLIAVKDIEAIEYFNNKLEDYFTVKQIAELFNKHPEAIREKLRSGRFKNIIVEPIKGIYYVEKKEIYEELRKKEKILDYISIREACEYLNCHHSTIRGYIKKGIIKDYILREQSEGYLINVNDLNLLLEDVPQGFLTIEDAAKKLKIGVGMVRKYAKSGKFKNSFKKKVLKGHFRWVISEIDIQEYINEESKDYKPDDLKEYSTLDIVKKFNFQTESLHLVFPDKLETIELFKGYALSKLSNSNAREETLKKKCAYYIKTLKHFLEKSNKNVTEFDDFDIQNFLNNKNTVEYIKQYFIGFIQYVSEDSQAVKFKNNYKSNRNTVSETQIYSKELFKEYFEYVQDIELHIGKAVFKKTYAQTWLYIIMHFLDAWRSGDIIYGLPSVNIEEIGIFNFEYFEEKRLTRTQAQSIINQVHLKIGKIKFSKTGALGQFLCVDSLAIPFATSICIVELHRRKTKRKIMLDSLRSNGINKEFFGNNEKLNQFDSLKMNRSLITYFFNYTSSSKGDSHLAYKFAQIMRSHKGEDTTSVYIKFSDAANSLDDISFNICERGHFGWVYNSMINLFFDQTNQNLLERTNMIKIFKDHYSLYELESLASFFLSERTKYESISLRLSKMSKDELKKLIIKVFRGEMPAKIEHAQCLSHRYCPYPTNRTCSGCEYLIPTDYLLFSISEEINTVLLKLSKSQTQRDIEKEIYILKKLLLLVNQAVIEKGEEYVDTFLNRKKIKEAINILIK